MTACFESADCYPKVRNFLLNVLNLVWWIELAIRHIFKEKNKLVGSCQIKQKMKVRDLLVKEVSVEEKEHRIKYLGLWGIVSTSMFPSKLRKKCFVLILEEKLRVIGIRFDIDKPEGTCKYEIRHDV